MDDFRRSGWWERGAEDTAELRNTVVFLTTVIIFFGNAGLVDKEDRDDARMACLARRVVGQRRRTGHNDEFADVFCLCRW